MRDTLIRVLLDEAQKNSRLYLLVGDLGWSVVEPFELQYPLQFLNVGVAEQNMVGVGAGLASEGVHVFAYSIGSFPTWRCAEQLRNDIDYHDLPYTTVTVGSGVTYGKLGYSHHAVQDIALMRSLPNTLLLCPCDPLETEICLKYILRKPAPSYLRLHKAGEPIITHSQSIEPCSLNYIRKNSSRKLILTTGISAQRVNSKAEDLNSVDFATLPIWSSKYSHSLVLHLSKYDQIDTYEDHFLAGGFGSWILEQFQIHKSLITGTIPSISCHYLGDEAINIVGSPEYITNLVSK
jgi:transketolase